MSKGKGCGKESSSFMIKVLFNNLVDRRGMNSLQKRRIHHPSTVKYWLDETILNLHCSETDDSGVISVRVTRNPGLM